MLRFCRTANLDPSNRNSGLGGALAGTGVASEAFQIGSQLGRALVAHLTIFLQSFADDALHFQGKVGIQAAERAGLLTEDGVEKGGGSVPVKRHGARGHLIEHSTEREEVAATVEFLA